MTKKIFGLLAFISISAFAFAASPGIADISQPELLAAIAGKSVVILDVNGSDSYHRGHIPGAIDFIGHQQELAKLLPANKDALIVAYCANEHCPAYKMGAEAAIALGYTNVKHFSPGIYGWQKSGAPMEKS
jgi:rhodanese-related sulfurtransferase